MLATVMWRLFAAGGVDTIGRERTERPFHFTMPPGTYNIRAEPARLRRR
jgi:hypothetical protein